MDFWDFSALILSHTSHSNYSMAAVSSASLCTISCRPTMSRLIHVAGNVRRLVCAGSNSHIDSWHRLGDRLGGGCRDLIRSCKTNALIKSTMLIGYVIRPITIHCSAFASSGYPLPPAKDINRQPGHQRLRSPGHKPSHNQLKPLFTAFWPSFNHETAPGKVPGVFGVADTIAKSAERVYRPSSPLLQIINFGFLAPPTRARGFPKGRRAAPSVSQLLDCR